TPALSLQAYAQIFRDAIRYSDFSTNANSANRRVVHLTDLMATPAPAIDPNVEETTLNVNAVLRWEYLPGSTLFAVYTRAQEENARAVDAFLVKLTYWWGS